MPLFALLTVKNLAWLWNAAEDTKAQDAGDLNSQHAAHAAIELCLGCAAFTHCRSWASYDRYTGLAGGRYLASGRPTGRRPPTPPMPAPLKLHHTRLLSGAVHATTTPQPATMPGRGAGPDSEATFVAYFLLPLQTPLLLEPDASYAFLEDISYVDYITAHNSDPNVDIERLRRTTGKREASLRIHPIPPDTADWKPAITTALPWLAPAAVDAVPGTDRPTACLIEACMLMDSRWPTQRALQDSLDYTITCVRQLQGVAARTERRRTARLTRQSLPSWVGVAVTTLNADHQPGTGHFWLMRTNQRTTDTHLHDGNPAAHRRRGCHPDVVPEDPEDPRENAEPGLRLVGGINFTTWPDLKWSRGNSHVAAFRSRFNEWVASAALTVDPVLRDDHLGIDLVARAPRGIPTHEWALDIGDAVHNLRSAFDALAWGMAHANNAEPARPKAVAFPICETEKQWNDTRKAWVGDLPQQLQDRLRLVQPFTYAPQGAASVLSLLHELDIQDKHHDILTVAIDLQPTELHGFFEYEQPDAQGAPWVEMLSDVKFGDGVVLGTLHTGAPAHLVGQMFIHPQAKAQIEHRNTLYDALPLLEYLLVESRRHLDILMWGLAESSQTSGERWMPMNDAPVPGNSTSKR